MWFLSPSGWPTHADSPEEQADLTGRGYTPIDAGQVQAAIEAFNAGQPAPDGGDPLTLAEAATAIAATGNPLGDAARGAFAPSGLRVTNLAGLSRWGEARGQALYRALMLTVLGDSISFGVGSDDTNNGTDFATMRQRGWTTQLRKLLNAYAGAADVDGTNWYGLTSAWDAGTVTLGGTVTQSDSLGPFGSFPPQGSGGGLAVGSGDTVTLAAATSNLGRFTEIDVYYWGDGSGVGLPSVPLVTVDGVAKNAPSGNVGGIVRSVTITGLTDATHDVVISQSAADTTAGRQAYVFAIGVRRDSKGFVVNRIARAGAESKHAAGVAGAMNAQQVQRNVDSAVMRGLSPLLVLALGTNDQGNQASVASYKTNLQSLINAQVAGGGCVLLLGEPPDPTPAAGTSEQAYRDAMRELAIANQHVAYTDARDLYGDPATMFARGLSASDGTVHPSGRGHGILAQAVAQLLLLPRYA